MSLLSESETMVSLSAQVRVPMATIENVAEDLRRALNSIQAIAYYVEMTLPLSELSSLGYLHKLQELVDECHEILHPLVHDYAAARNVVSKAIETSPEHAMFVVSAGGGLP
jgi:hypothetical protein